LLFRLGSLLDFQVTLLHFEPLAEGGEFLLAGVRVLVPGGLLKGIAGRDLASGLLGQKIVLGVEGLLLLALVEAIQLKGALLRSECRPVPNSLLL
jgi:hypothetical protein